MGFEKDRVVIVVYDIGLCFKCNDKGEIGYQVWIGGGFGCMFMIGQVVWEFLFEVDLLFYIEVIIVVYNFLGCCDNKYKVCIKIIVVECGFDVMCEEIEVEFLNCCEVFLGVDQDYLVVLKVMFVVFDFCNVDDGDYEVQCVVNLVFCSWIDINFMFYKVFGYVSVKISFKVLGQMLGDVLVEQMDLLVDLVECYGYYDLCISYDQNVVMLYVYKLDLFVLYQDLKVVGLVIVNVGLILDIVVCFGMDYCVLVIVCLILIVEEIVVYFWVCDIESEIGKIDICILGCINVCGYYYLGYIGILGLDCVGVENYQIMLGGDGYDIFVVGQKFGVGFGVEDVVVVVDCIINIYFEVCEFEEECFIDVYCRVGMVLFKVVLYLVYV